MPMFRPAAALLSALLLAAVSACTRDPAPERTRTMMRAAEAEPPHETPAVEEARATPEEKRVDVRRSTRWPSAKVSSGEARISCTLDYAADGDGTALVSLEFFSVLDAMGPCQDAGVVRLSYDGKIAADFVDLVERVSAMADRMNIRKRVLDLNSSGGQVEDAIVAGDAIGESGWTIWVREKATCHSSCVLVLAAGDNRMIAGEVGIHRMMRVRSKATTRAELSRELQDIYDQVKDYLQRNGVAVAVADLMMTVPNRSLRLLSSEEMERFGLSGPNAAQEDLNRIVLMRECGEAFVWRKDAFLRAYADECEREGRDVDEVNACGIALRERYGFPDPECPDESPLSEYDARLAAAPPAEPRDADADQREPARARRGGR
ncbi:MAG TPA: hypothetical protein VEY50_02375 [Lysobacter sp.]|nr:hypothetical protein [Lysobacter sp.]